MYNIKININKILIKILVLIIILIMFRDIRVNFTLYFALTCFIRRTIFFNKKMN